MGQIGGVTAPMIIGYLGEPRPERFLSGFMFMICSALHRGSVRARVVPFASARQDKIDACARLSISETKPMMSRDGEPHATGMGLAKFGAWNRD